MSHLSHFALTLPNMYGCRGTQTISQTCWIFLRYEVISFASVWQLAVALLRKTMDIIVKDAPLVSLLLAATASFFAACLLLLHHACTRIALPCSR